MPIDPILAYRLYRDLADNSGQYETFEIFVLFSEDRQKFIWRKNDEGDFQETAFELTAWNRIAFFNRRDSHTPQLVLDAFLTAGENLDWLVDNAEPSVFRIENAEDGSTAEIGLNIRPLLAGHYFHFSSEPQSPMAWSRIKFIQKSSLFTKDALAYSEVHFQPEEWKSFETSIKHTNLNLLAETDLSRTEASLVDTEGGRQEGAYPVAARLLSIPYENTVAVIREDVEEHGYIAKLKKKEIGSRIPVWPLGEEYDEEEANLADYLLFGFQQISGEDKIPRLYFVCRRALMVTGQFEHCPTGLTLEPNTVATERGRPIQRRLVMLTQRQRTDHWQSDYNPILPHSWILTVEGFTRRDGWNFWNNRVVRPYISSLRQFEGRYGLSGMPMIEDDPEDTTEAILAQPDHFAWRLVYEYLDRHPDTNPIDFSRANSDLRLLTILPFGPKNGRDVDIAIPAIRDQSGDPLKFGARIGVSSGALSGNSQLDEECVPGPRFFLLQHMPKRLDELQCIRAGALDLVAVDSSDANRSKGLWGSGEQSPYVTTLRIDFRSDLCEKMETEAKTELPEFATIATNFLKVDLDARYGLISLAPGGQDPTPLETVDVAFRRNPPITVPLTKIGNNTKKLNDVPIKPPYTLRIEEKVVGDDPRSIIMRINAFEIELTTSVADAFISIDQTPFLIAKVDTGGFTLKPSAVSNEIAKWVGADLDGASWEIPNVPEFDLLLPPQGIGEAMERDKGAHDIEQNGHADFRFAPPAKIRLESSYFDKRFAEVPWNLRRLLGYPGQRAPGAGVVNFRFELFYGMTGRVEYSALRLAEFSSRIGALAGSVFTPAPRQLRLLEVNGKKIDPIIKNVRMAFSEAWRTIHARYNTRLAVLEPWNGAQPDSLLLDTGVQFELRPGADLKYPVDPDPYENIEKPNPNVPRNKDGLAGGFAWPFQSSNVYESVWREPVSNTARLSDARFSALGGWGKQKATFDNERTTIFADVAMGRTYCISVERIGRIGVFWNRAKHVVIYERSTSPTDQFYGRQDHHIGRPVLRKVREYVEILQPSRSYPEFGAARITRGFVLGCDFVSTVIPVDSSWGRDVSNAGWEVPLWVPPAANDEIAKRIYRKPQVALRVAVDPDTSEDSAARELSAPENLVFFTSTRAGFGADTDAWPAELEVDYPDQPTPRPDDIAAGDSRNPDRRMPNATAVAAGFGRFTFPVLPDERQVNMLAERGERAIGSLLHNVAMMRARPRGDTASLSAPVREAMAAAAAAERLPEQVRGMVQDIRGLVDSWADSANLSSAAAEEIRRHIEDLKVSSELGKLTVDATQMLDKAGKLFEGKNPCQLAQEEIGRGLSRARERVTGLLDTLRRDVLETIDQLVAQGQQSADVAEALVDGIFERLVGLPHAAGTEIGAMRATIRRIEGEVDTAFAEITDDLDAMILTVREAASLEQRSAEARTAARRAIGRLETLESKIAGLTRGHYVKLAESFSDRLRELRVPLAARLDDVERDVLRGDGALGELFDQLENEIDAASAVVTSLIHQPLQEADRVFDSFETPILQLIGGIAEIRDRKAAFTAEVQKALRGNVAEAKRGIIGKIAAWHGAVDKAAQDLNDKIVKELEAGGALGALCQQFFGDKPWSETVGQVEGWLKDPATGLLHTVEGYIRDNANVEEIRREIDRFGDELQGELEALADRVAPGLRDTLGATAGLGEALHQLGDNTLQLVRAFARKPDLSDFNRENLGYFYDELKNSVDLTPVTALVNRLGDDLKGLGIRLPTRQLLDQIIPDPLEGINFGDIFPDFSGLRALLPELELPDLSTDKVKVTQGVDRQSRRAWVQADVDFKINEPTPVFDYGPVKVTLVGPHFTARSKNIAALDGQVESSMHGTILGDWDLEIGGMQIVRFAQTPLVFDEEDGVRFELDPTKVEMQAALQFLSDLTKELQVLGDELAGLGIEIIKRNGLPIGAASRLNIPVPDIQLGTFGITNMHFGASFELVALPDFSIGTRFYLGRSTAPFNLTIFILGGGGWVDASARFLPVSSRIQTELSIGIGASAMLALNLGVIRGGILIYFGINLVFYSDSAGEDALTVSIVLLIEGSASLAGLVTVGIGLRLEASYRNDGSLTGTGTLSYRVKICWCFTLNVRQSVAYEFAKGSGDGGAARVTDSPDLRGRRRAEMREYLDQFA